MYTIWEDFKLISVSKLNQTRHINLEKIILLASPILSFIIYIE